ncbi:MAG: DUF2339 domain-containing protein [Acidobacteriota bacterium]|nr:MAG: DUF2339 domain-containing protein [Acidobacteriota bacterium]
MADENPEPDSYAKLNQRLDQLESVIYQQISRIFELEKRLGLDFTPPEPVIETTPPPVETQPEAVVQWPSEPKPEPVPEIRTPVIEPAPAEPKTPWFRLPEAKDLESIIGGNWFNRIGILAIILAVGFFLKYAFENQWIGPAGRIMIGIAIGIGFLLGGERLRARGYRHYAHGLSGGGIAILYLAIFAAFGRYHLISQLPAFAFMSLITATAVLLSARYDALAIAILGLIGGFLTPVMLSTGRDNQTGLFSYIIVLDLGVLALAWFKQWRILNYLAFIATVLMSAGWLDEWYAPEKLWKTVFFFTVLFVIFALLAVLHNVIYRRRVILPDVALIMLNAGLYFATAYRLLEAEQHSMLGLFAILVSAFYLGLGYLTWQRDREDRYLVLTFLGLASLFLTLAIPIQLDQHWTTMAWAIEGAILVWIAQRTGSRLTYGAALAIFAVALLHWLKFDLIEFSFRAGEVFTPLFNKRGASSLVLIASLAVAVRLLSRSGKDNFEPARPVIMMSCLIAAASLLLVWLSFDIRDFFEAARFPYRERIDREPALWNAITRLDSIKHLCLTALWSVFASLLLTGGFRHRLMALRIAGLALLAMTLGKVILLDTQYYAALWRMLILNPVFGSFAIIVAALVFSYLSYARAGETVIRERNDVLNGLLAAGNLAALIGLCVEASGHFTARMQLSDPSRSWFDAVMRDFSLTAIISIYGAVLLGLALKRNRPWLQVASLALLGIASLKVVLIDLTGAISGRPLIFNPIFGGFVIVIASLALGLRTLSRSGSDETWQKRSIQLMLIVINFLGLVALSAESNNYFDGRLTQLDVLNEEWKNLYLARQLSLSIIWGVYGGAMLLIGIWRRNRLARIMALGILGMTIVKVFLFDLSSLDQLYRIISFVMLGIVLLVVSYVYQRLIKSAEGGQP